MILDLPPHVKCVAALYVEKIERSTAQLFIPISQNNVGLHIRLIVRMINWEVFLFNRIYI